MTASQLAKSLGCKNLKEVSGISGIPVNTLLRWHKEKPDAFRVMCIGVVNSR
jgi:hypothetical protein